MVGIFGELDCATAPELERRIGDLVEDQGNLKVVLDLKDMSFVDSSGLSVFASAHKRLTQREGELILAHPSPSTAKVLAITGLDQVIPTV